MATSQGYKSDFLYSVPEDYYCKKCSLVARRLTVTSCCGEHYCHTYITGTQQEEKPCPECGEQFFSCFEVVRHLKHIASLKVYCTLKGRGCDWSETLEELEAHLDPDLDNCKNGLIKLTDHWLPQFHLLISLFIYREARKRRTFLEYM